MESWNYTPFLVLIPHAQLNLHTYPRQTSEPELLQYTTPCHRHTDTDTDNSIKPIIIISFDPLIIPRGKLITTLSPYGETGGFNWFVV